jgi:L-aminopeptidase/D-esterase-like protein
MHLVQHVHAVLLAGGSAFGLAAADGVMRYLRERGVGYDTRVAGRLSRRRHGLRRLPGRHI